jgi:predicted ATPase
MRIKSISLTDYNPIKYFRIDNLGNTIVIAGANGSGKTRLKEAIVAALQGNAIMDITIEATRPEEEDAKYFGGPVLELKKGVGNNVLTNYINSRQYGSGRYVGSLVQIDSNRSIQTLKYNPVNWLGGDPDDVDSVGTFYFNPFSNRWQDFVNYIHQKSAARDKKLAEEMKANPDKNGREILEKYPDPFEKYKKIFEETLPGKRLLDIDPAKPREFRYNDSFGQDLSFSSLSSGEQEVIKVLFDVARKEIRHSIIIVDEPELHLHPTLTFRLIESLKSIGEHTNQFIFLTHSSDLITTYYSTGDVYFIDSKQDGSNQANRLSDLIEMHQDIIPLIGQNLGLFAVGKKLVFVEGEESSIDRLAYQKIAHYINPEIRVIPAGSVFNIMTLNNVEEQIRNTIFGIDMYMIRDRDGLDDKQIESLEKNGRIRCLKRRHIENYFLDEEIIFAVAETLYITRINPSLNIDSIRDGIKRIADDSLTLNICKNTKEYLSLNHFLKAPSVKNIEGKDLENVKQELAMVISENVTELATNLQKETIQKWINDEETKLRNSLSNGKWTSIFQGKYIFKKLCSDILRQDEIRVRHAYIDIALEKKPSAIQEIIDIFADM